MTTPIPLVDLNRQHEKLSQEINSTLSRIVKQGNFILGKEVAEFEHEFAAFCETTHAVGVASGTDALFLALKAAGLGPGDTVITAADTFIATALAVNYTGADVRLVDVDPDTYNMNAAGLESAVERALQEGLRVKAIIPVHLYGRPCEMDSILDVASKYDLLVIEDACQAHGACFPLPDQAKPVKVGGFGLAGCFSFFPGKNLGGLGDGGMVVTNSQHIADQIKLLRNYGSVEKYVHQIKGGNSRLDTLQAAVLQIKLRHLEQWNTQRQELAALYRNFFALLPSLAEKIIIPNQPRAGTHVYHLFVVRVPERNNLLSHLHAKGIFAGVHYPIPIHLQHAFQDLKYRRGDFPVSERLADEIISLPIFPGMTEREVKRVVAEINSFYLENVHQH